MKLYRHPLISKYLLFGIIGLLILSVAIIPVRIAIASYQYPQPQAILTLGGGIQREQYTARFAQFYPDLDIWVSSGVPPQQAQEVFANAGISKERVHLDYRAIDTVTNFTSLAEDFHRLGFHHLYLITSDFHMRRARAIATLVLGSQGIIFTPIAIPTQQPRESLLRVIRDSGRSLLWIVTGRTGASLHPHNSPQFYAFR